MFKVIKEKDVYSVISPQLMIFLFSKVLLASLHSLS